MLSYLLGAGKHGVSALSKVVDVNAPERAAGRIADGGCQATKLGLQTYVSSERLSELRQVTNRYGRDADVTRETVRDVYRAAAENKRSQEITASTLKALGYGAGALISFKLGGVDIDTGS